MSRPPRGPIDPVVCVLTKRGRLVVAEPLFEPGDRISLPGKAQGDARVGDIVLCKVRGQEYLHLIRAVQGRRFQIGNNRGHVNGWIGPAAIFGKCVRVQD